MTLPELAAKVLVLEAQMKALRDQTTRDLQDLAARIRNKKCPK
jgi:hypothetical protein